MTSQNINIYTSRKYAWKEGKIVRILNEIAIYTDVFKSTIKAVALQEKIHNYALTLLQVSSDLMRNFFTNTQTYVTIHIL